MDGNDNIGQLAEARPRKRQRGNGASDSGMQLDPNLQPQAAPQNIAMAPIQPQLQDYSPNIRQQPLQHEYQPEMRQQGQPESSEYPRRRAMVACEICRGRKTRCDGAKPKCRLCTELNAECVYREPGQKLDAGDKMILEHLQRIESMLQSGYQPGHSNGNSARDYPSDGFTDGPSLDPAVQRHSTNTSRDGGFINLTPDDQAYRRRTGTAGSQTLFREIIQGSAVRRLLPISLDDSTGLAAESKRSKLSIQGQTNMDVNEITSHVDAYFQLLHPYHAVINAETWQAIYATASLNGFARGLESSTVLLIAALGWNVVTGNKLYTAKLEDTLGFQLFSQAWSILPEMLASNGASAIQCLFLGSAYLLSTFRPLDAWYTLSLASSKLETGMTLRNELAPAESEALKRLYWNVEHLKTDIRSAVEVQQWSENPLHQTVGLPTGYSQDIALGSENGDLGFLSPQIWLQRLRQRAAQAVPYSLGQTINLDALLPLAQTFHHQLNQWYERLPEMSKFQQEVPTTSLVQSELRLGFFACRAQILRAIVYEAMRDGSLLLDQTIRDHCKQCLEAAVRQIENTSVL
ncbi:hypothetical protein B9Z65_6538 [Elsinoe australis]|uniref:Zn(2)-C6 fungal-type domain-containing protein n=1 Tax=Elsinoe australis TaxID=40998 RepID=A0A2P8A8X0_9PEZI|nr:hypothetical protein B9Z65_6538 [Elsinoe australis]